MEKEFAPQSPNMEQQLAMRVSVITILINVLLSLFKFAAGILAGSGAMISDAVHSASDVLSTLVVIAGVRLSHRDSDKEHPYGHDRFECVASIILAVMLLLTGIGIGIAGTEKIISGTSGTLAVPGRLALIAALISIVIKEWMYWYTRAAAKKINSGALMADAWHHRSDALSSVGAFVGILGARVGYPILDPVASLVICLFIVKAAIDIFKDACDKMLDKACDEATEESIRQLILAQEGVEGVDKLKTRLFGAKFYVDVEILADGALTLEEAHAIAEKTHDAIESAFPNTKHCMIHVNPATSPIPQ